MKCQNGSKQEYPIKDRVRINGPYTSLVGHCNLWSVQDNFSSVSNSECCSTRSKPNKEVNKYMLVN